MDSSIWERRMGKRVSIVLLSLILTLGVVNPGVYAAPNDAPTFDVSQPEKLTIGGYEQGATLNVYHFTGGALALSETNVTGSSITVDLPPGPSGYYMQQISGGFHSATTIQFNTSLTTPVMTSETDSLIVSNVAADRTLELYLNSPSELTSYVASYDNVSGTYRFANVDPNSRQYYVVQKLGNVVSSGSSLHSPSAHAPTVTAGIEKLTVSNVYSSVEELLLYRQHDGPAPYSEQMPNTATYDSVNNVWDFESLQAGAYYVVQKINGVVSLGSNIVTVSDQLPDAPVATGEAESIQVTGYETGATLKLYLTNANSTPIATETTVSQSTYTFQNVLPEVVPYYVTQTISGKESLNSNHVNTILRQPTATSNVESIDVTNVSGNTTLELRNVINDAVVSSTPTHLGNGTYRFENVEPNHDQYYVIQKHNGFESLNSVFQSPSIRKAVLTGGAEYVDVTNIYPGATFVLHEADGTASSIMPVDRGNGIWRFEAVPAGTGYHVIQKFQGVQSESNRVTVTEDRPVAPTILAGEESLEVSGIVSGATLKLYTTLNTPVATYPTVTGSTYTISNLIPHIDSYYVTQSVGGKESLNSNFANPTLRTPTAVAGEGYIEVSNVTPGATLHLHRADTHELLPDAAVVWANGIYRFENVQPYAGMYYVTQSLGGSESSNTAFLNPVLPIPWLVGGTNYVNVLNVYTGATLSLYDSNDQLVSNQPIAVGNGTYRFNNLPEGSGYYVIQTINGVVSSSSNMASISLETPAAPTAIGQEESIRIQGHVPGATLKLYVTDGTLIRTVNGVTDSVYTMEGVLPNALYYYVTQTVNGKESVNSEFANTTLRIPSVTPVLDGIEVRGVSADAALKLHDAKSGALVSVSAESLGGGVYRFNSVEPREGAYYITQSIHGIDSVNSLFVNPILRTPTASSNARNTVDVGNLYPGATVKLHRTSNNQELSIQATDVGGGVFRFSSVPAGSYYVVQSVNTVPSPRSTLVTVQGSDPVVNEPTPPVVNTPSTTPTITAPTAVDILINGRAQKIGTLTNTTQEGRSVQTIQVNPTFVRDLLNAEPNGVIVTIPFANDSTATEMVSEFDGSLVRLMQQKQATLVVRTPIAEYRLPTTDIRLVSGASGTEESTVRVNIAYASATNASMIDNLLTNFVSTRVGQSVSFKVTSSTNGQTVSTDRFSSYVERLLPLPSSVEPEDIVTAVVFENGVLRHVPTRIVVQDGVRYAAVNSFSNGTYTLVAGRSSFSDIGGHWAAVAIEDMASRLVLQGTGDGRFDPARSITRAEFASILTAGLGLAPDSTATTFNDVAVGQWYSDSVAAAAQYGVINGFGDGTFRPSQTITRAEAMTMLARAMRISGLESGASSESDALSGFVDQALVPAWARDAAAANVQAGLIEGMQNNLLSPGTVLSRAQAAALIQRLLLRSELI